MYYNKPVKLNLENLNPEQLRAVQTTDGAVLVLAGAGKGKTRVLTTRGGYILDKNLAAPWQVLALTFTNKAANEMKSRIDAMADGAFFARDIWCGTFHSICLRILRTNYAAAGLRSDFLIYGDDDQKSVVKKVLSDMNITTTKKPSEYIEDFSRIKDRGLTTTPSTDRIFNAYNDELRRMSAVDFGDIILLVLKLFENFPDILARYQKQFKYILVDEFQDTNGAQMALLKMLTKDSENPNICCVGDDDQSIYSWRGAEIKNINMVSECGYFDGELKYNLGSIPDNSFVEYEFMDEAGNLVYNSIVLGNGYNDTVNHEYDNIDTDSYVNRCDIYSANLKSGDCISYEHVNGSGTFDLTGVIVGDKPNKVTIEGKEATIENTYKEKVYKFTCPVDIKTGINNFRVSIDQANGLTTTKDYKNIIYNGQGPQISLETGIKNAVGVVKTALRKYKFTLNINSEFEGYDIYINGDLYGTYGDTSDMFFAAEKEKAFNITYILDDQNVHYIDVKVVDLCGNVSEEVFKVQRRIMVELVKTKENLNNTSVNYTRKWTYTGEEITPKFVIACKGVTLIEGIDYEVSYSNNVNIGAGIITVNGIEDYTGTKVYSFKIIPKKAVIKKVTSKKTKKGYNTIKIKNQEGNVRYQIKYSNKKTSGFVTLKKTKNNNYKTKKLLKKKTYYFKVRAYKTVNGATYYGKWSKIYKVRIK